MIPLDTFECDAITLARDYAVEKTDSWYSYLACLEEALIAELQRATIEPS